MSMDFHGERHYFDKDPDRCPLCFHWIKPSDEKVRGVPGQRTWDQRETVEVVYRCPRDEWARLFIARYECAPHGGGTDSFGGTRPLLRLVDCVPKSPAKYQAPAEVAGISPRFEELMGQALTAQLWGLDQVAGGGFRKALEFLVKDFCASEHKEKRDSIHGMPLAACIREFVTDDNVKITASRAAWLGNDELHYVREWKDKDVEHMKGLIRLVVIWIESLLKTRALEQEMPERGKRGTTGPA